MAHTNDDLVTSNFMSTKMLTRVKFTVTIIIILLCQNSFAQVAPITGVTNICGLGDTTALSDATPAGTWSSSNTSVATINAVNGTVTGVAAGSVIISYVVGASYAVTPLTVNIAPGSISGSASICSGLTTSLSATPPSGTWTSNSTVVATVGSSSGIVTGVSIGTATISYTLANGCYSTQNLTVNASPSLYAVTGGGAYCSGGAGVPVGLSGSQPGANYQLFNGAMAIGSALPGTGSAISFGLQVAAGNYTIVANYGGSCSATMSGSAVVSVNTLPTAYNVSGGGSYCAGGVGVSVHLNNSATGCNYTLYNGITVAGTFSGTGTTLDFGNQLAGTYTVIATNTATGCINSMSGSAIVTANPLPANYSVSGGGAYCFGGTGVLVGLGNSDLGASYQLYVSGVPVGAPISGIGSPITFGSQTASGTYTVVATNTTTGCTAPMSGSATVSVNPLPASISGPSALCMGSTASLSDGTLGGTWSSANPTIASVGSAGLVSGLTSGTVTINYTLPTTCTRAYTITVNISPSITGASSVCIGSSTTFTAVPGGTWSSAPSTVANIGSSSGIVTPLAPGAATITCSYAGCSNSVPLSVNPSPAAISGVPAVCIGNTTTLTDPTLTGTWSTTTPAIGTISPTGAVTAISAGNMLISYTLPAGCRSVYTLTVIPAPCDPLFALSLCVGNTTTATHSCLPSGGVWTSNYPGIASIGSASGIVTGIAAGVTPLTYTIAGGGCSLAKMITVNSAPGAISGLTKVCTGFTIPLSDAIPGGSWSSSNTAIATVGTSGIVTGVAAGAAAINYTLSGCSTAKSITVNALPVAYTVTGGGSYCAGGSGVSVMLSGSELGVLYQLYNGSSPVGSATAGTGLTLSFGPLTTTGLYTIKANDGLTGCSAAMSGSVGVSITPLPTAFAVTGGGSYCAGGSGVHIGLAGSQTGVVYQLFYGGSPAGSPVAGTGLAIDFGPQLLTGTYTVTANSGSCSAAMTGTAVVALYTPPSAFVLTGGGSYCSGDTGRHIYLSGSQAATTYRLYFGASLVDSMTGTGSSLDFGLFTASGTYTATATSLATTCASNMGGSITIAVNPLPATFSVTGGGNYCAGGTGVHIGLGSSAPGVNYSLFHGVTMVGSIVPGTGSAIDFGLQTASGVYTVTGTNASTGCSNSMTGAATVSITPSVTPSVSLAVSTGDTVCAGTPAFFTASPVNGGASPLYMWYVNGVMTGTIGTTYLYLPSTGDIVAVRMISSATCATPDTVFGHAVMTVNPHPSISGPGSVCVGSTISLTSSVGSTWVSGAPSVATVATVGTSTGVVTAMAPGTTTITCYLSGCSSTAIVTVNATPTVSVTTTRSCGGSTTLTASGATDYNWAPSAGLSCTTCASPDAYLNSSITYTVSGSYATGCTDTEQVFVDGNRISGYISYGSSSYDTFRVWLIQFNPADSSLISEDSTLSCMASGTPYYEFRDKPTGDYLVKAKLLGQPYGITGYAPAYGLSTPYWASAASVLHGAATDTLHINMIYGVVPAGVGFIGGNIATGAAKGTTLFLPAPNVLVYLKDAVSNDIITYTYTDGLGNYSFSNIANGNYIVYPEGFSYHTTQSGILAITTSVDSLKHTDFRIYTVSRLILPLNLVGIASIGSATTLSVYPNPATETLNIKWNGLEPGSGDLSITDVLGHDVLHSQLNIDTADGEHQLSTAHLSAGVYIMAIRSGQINFVTRLVIAR